MEAITETLRGWHHGFRAYFHENEWEIGLAEVIAVLAVYYFVRSTWRSLPVWAKPSFLHRGDEKILDGRANQDLNNPVVICGKLKEMMDLAGQKCEEATPDDCRMDMPQVVGGFLAAVHLWRELRNNHPRFRHEQYHDYQANRTDGLSGRPVDAATDDLANLATHLDYSAWAYVEDYDDLRRKLSAKSFDLLRQDLTTEPGRVGHYIAVNYASKVAMIGIKGTSHVSDIVTDLVAKSVPQTLATSPFDKTQKDVEIRVHEGIWTAAVTLADELQDLIEHVFIPGGFQIFICGHSLGAGTSCLLGLLLRSRLPRLQDKLPNGVDDALRVVAFATPAVLNFDACVASASYCTSVVNNSDIVPRASVSNLVITNRLIVHIRSKVKGRYSDYKYKVAKNFKAFYKNITDLLVQDDETIMTPDEWDAFFDDTHRSTTVSENLYVPGKVICLYERADTDDDETAKEYGGVVADGGMKMLRQIEFTATMVSDHSCSFYSETINGFTKQTMDGGDKENEGNKKDD